jgi:hypothetical protein
MLKVLTYALRGALETGEPTGSIVLQIGGELLNERAPTPDEMDFNEDAYWERQRELQQGVVGVRGRAALGGCVLP